jgi:hypothetical protein
VGTIAAARCSFEPTEICGTTAGICFLSRDENRENDFATVLEGCEPNKDIERLNRGGVPRVTAHAMRGMLADLGLRRAAPRVADYLGHEDERTTRESYAAEEGARRCGLKVLEGGKAS